MKNSSDPLYKLIFLEDCPCLLEGALESIKEYGDYFFTEDGTYLRMHGGTKAPLLLLKYATNYIVLKETIRQVFIDGFGNHLFDIKKVVFPPVPFYVGSYKFNGVKSAPYFVKELEISHFGEVSFHRNDSQGKVATHKSTHKVNYEYSDYVDKEEQVFRNVYSMVAVSKQLKRKSSRVKGGSSNNPKLDEGKEEAIKKEQEETTQRLAVGENKLLVEEA